ncbi:DUF1120 domain-containing protein [Herbaspirillum rhizosphaerae]|uniref:DUF1120 domain-containing protein n=1 Tax=Herbaspirillum rhizosphaerae TaxID=346179 RepID=UPI00142F2C49|nr:DUF1120 domain-containing protein [Herbaspirillum rhizosphaerae]
MELRVVGRIVPEACVPAVSDGGIVRYGNFPEDARLPDSTTVLGKKTMTLSVSCSFNANLAIRIIDNRRKTAPVRRLVVANRSYSDAYHFGLGRPTEDSGGYLMAFESSGAERGAATFLESNPKNPSPRWELMKDNFIKKNTLYTWAQHGAVATTGSKSFQADLSLQTVVQGEQNRADKGSADLDGSVTLELLYL